MQPDHDPPPATPAAGHDPVPDGPATVHGARARRADRPVAALLASLAALAVSLPVSDNSAFTHLVVGRILLDDGLPTTNPFLFPTRYTSGGFPVPSWWWSATLALTERVGGLALVRVVVCALAAALAVLAVRLCRTADGAPRGLLAATAPPLVVLACASTWLNARPQLPALVLVACSVVVVREHRSAWWLFPVGVTLVNVHGSWLLALAALVGCALAGVLPGGPRRAAALVASAAAGTLVGAMAYPQPFAMVTLTLRQLTDRDEARALRAYAEWGPMDPTRPVSLAFLALAAASLWWCWTHRAWRPAALVTAGLAAVAVGWRLSPTVALMVLPAAAATVDRLGTRALPGPRGARRATALAAVVALAALVVAATPPHLDLSAYPVEVVDALDDQGLVGPRSRVLVPDWVGNYLGLRDGREASTFVDDRPGASTMLAQLDLVRVRPGWQEVLAEVDPDVVVWRSGTRFPRALRREPGWYQVGTHDGFVVLCPTRTVTRCRTAVAELRHG